MVTDLKSLYRGLRKSPGFAVAAVATLAIASGVLIATLLVVRVVLLRPLPVRDQDRVLVAWKEDVAAGFTHWPFSFAAFEAIRRDLTTVEQVSSIDYNGLWPLTASDGDRMIKVPAGVVSGGFFSLLGVTPRAGRLIQPADDGATVPRVAVIAESFWRDRYGSRPDAIGKSLTIWGFDYEIVGVVPEDFSYPLGAAIWVPMLALQPNLAQDPNQFI